MATALAVTTVAGMAEAQGFFFVDLEARLIQLDRGAGGGAGGNPRQFDVPIAQQRSEIDRAMAEARRSGCIGGFFIFPKTPAAKCGKLMATIDRMQNNLQRLMSERGQFGGDDASASEILADDTGIELLIARLEEIDEEITWDA